MNGTAGNHERSLSILSSLRNQDYELVMGLVCEIFRLYEYQNKTRIWTPQEIKDYGNRMRSYVEQVEPHLKNAKDVSIAKLKSFRNFLSSYIEKTRKKMAIIDKEMTKAEE